MESINDTKDLWINETEDLDASDSPEIEYQNCCVVSSW